MGWAFGQRKRGGSWLVGLSTFFCKAAKVQWMDGWAINMQVRGLGRGGRFADDKGEARLQRR